MNIKFYQPSDEKIPTILRLIVDGTQVHYERIGKHGIDYEFIVWDKDTDVADKIMNEIIRVMEYQSDDGYGYSWRKDSVNLEGHTSMYNRYIVKFRVRDAM